jgi:hypothetical protein
MKVVRKIIENAPDKITIELPAEYGNKKVEVIVLPLEKGPATEEKPKKYDFSKFFGKMKWEGDAVAEQRKLRDEWD